MSGSFLEIGKLKSGKFRLYEVEARAIMSWQGDNFHRSVVRDSAGSIVTFVTIEEARQFAREEYHEEVLA